MISDDFGKPPQTSSYSGKYEAEKESLLMYLDDLKAIALKIMDGDFARSFDSIASDLREERFRLAVLGGFKRGKSTLINALLGRAVLPTGVVPLTSVITSLRFGEAEGAEIRFMNGKRLVTEIQNLPEFITERGNPENRKSVAEAVVTVDSPFLSEELVVVDTPGIGSTNIRNTKTTEEFLFNIDAGIFVIGVDPPISQNEIEFLEKVMKNTSKIFFALNKIDYMEREEIEESLEFSRGVIAKVLGTDGIRLYPISTRKALEARMNGDTGGYEDSGLPVLENDLSEFLWNGKGMAILDSVRRKARRLAEELLTAIEIELKMASESVGEIQRKLDWLRRKAGDVECRIADAEKLVDAGLERIIDGLDRRLNELKESSKGRMTAELSASLDGIDPGMGAKECLEVIEAKIAGLISGTFTPFIRREEQVLNDDFLRVASRFEKEVNAILGEVRDEISGFFQIKLPSPVRFEIPAERTRFYFGEVTVLNYDTILPAELPLVLPTPLFRRWMRKKAMETMIGELDRHSGKVRYDFIYRLNERKRHLKSVLKSSLDLTLATIRRGIGYGEGLMDSALPVRETRIKELRAYREDLLEIINELTCGRYPQGG